MRASCLETRKNRALYLVLFFSFLPIVRGSIFFYMQARKDHSGHPLPAMSGGANGGGQCLSEEKELREKVNSEVGQSATDNSNSYLVHIV